MEYVFRANIQLTAHHRESTPYLSPCVLYLSSKLLLFQYFTQFHHRPVDPNSVHHIHKNACIQRILGLRNSPNKMLAADSSSIDDGFFVGGHP
jgi:hypothetical protein